MLSLAVSQNKVAELLRHSRSLLPLHGILVALVGGALGGSNGVQLQEGVVGEQEDESLADGASGAQDPYPSSVQVYPAYSTYWLEAYRTSS